MKLLQKNKLVASQNLNPGYLVLFCGVLVLLISSAVLLGWIIHIPMLVRVRPDWVPMVFNTAICCYLSGLALILSYIFKHHKVKVTQRAISLVILLISSLVMMQILFGFNFNIDSPELHRSLQPGYTHPGRMAPNTSLALILFSLGLLFDTFKQWPDKKRSNIVQILAILVSILGWLGLLSYWINLEYLYNWTSNVRMSVPTAICVTLMGLALFNIARQILKEKSDSTNTVSKIYYTSAFAMTMISLTAGVSGFVTVAQRSDDMIADHIQQMAQDRRFFFNVGIRARSEQAILLSRTPNIAPVLAKLNQTPNDATLQQSLINATQALSKYELTAIAYEGLNGQHWKGMGQLIGDDHFKVNFHGDYPGTLLWNSGYQLRTKAPILDTNRRVVGYMLVEQRLKALNQLRENTILPGSSRDMVICSADGSFLDCFPSSTEQKPFRVPNHYQNQRLPMSYALDDAKTGVMTALDYRGNRVLAAYGPIANTGLGMVVKINVAEIYSPIKEQLHKAAAVILGLLALGLWLIYKQLLPLVQSIENARSQAEQDKARFVAATEGGFDSFYIFDSIRNEKNEVVDFRCSYINQRGGELFDKNPQDFIGKLLLKELSFTSGHMYFDRFKAVIESGETIYDELQLDDAHIKAAWIAHQIVKLGDGVAVTLRDISEQKKTETYMRHVAMHDVLTNLPNRALFEDRVKIAIEQAKRDNQQVVVALIDLDYFKQVNDTLGHHVGDALLQELAVRFKLNIRPSDTIARLGGDEFALVLPNVPHPKGSRIVLTKLFKILQQPVIAAGHKIHVSISVGVAAFPNDGNDLAILMRHADEAMYNAKAAGRNNFQIYEAGKK